MDQFREFDGVIITKTENIQWLFMEPNDVTGIWSVVSATDDTLVLSRDTLLIRIPISDVHKVASYSLDTFIDYLQRNSSYGQEQHPKSKQNGSQ